MIDAPSSNSRPSDDNQCDLLLIVALEEEFKNLVTSLSVHLEPTEIDGLSCFRFRLPAPRGAYAECVATFVGEMGITDTNLTTFQLITALKPGLVVNVGLSGIVDSEVRLGDVIAASESDDCLRRSKVKQRDPKLPLTFDDLHLGGKSLPTTESYYRIIDNLPFTDDALWDSWISDSAKQLNAEIDESTKQQLESFGLLSAVSKVHVGPLACGPWVGTSTQLKEVLKKRNRNYLAMDMESFGVLQAAQKHKSKPDTLILRGISDPADERKKEFDNVNSGALRRWAISNAFRTLSLVISKVELPTYSRRDPQSLVMQPHSKDELVHRLHECVVREYLNAPYNNFQYVRSHSYESYSALFSLFADIQNETPNLNVFEMLTQLIASTADANAILIEGAPGTGKSSLLSIFYWHLFDQRIKGSEVVPFLVNLHRYNEVIPDREDISVKQQTAIAVKRHLEPLREFVTRYPDHPLVVIIDGHDDFARFKDETSEYLSSLLKPSRHWKVIGSREGVNALNPEARAILPAITVVLQPISVREASYLQAIETFCSVTPQIRLGDSESIRETISACKLKQIDLFTLSLIVDHRTKVRLGKVSSQAALLESFCQTYLRTRVKQDIYQLKLIERAATIGFRYEMEKKTDIQEGEQQLWDLVQQHSRVCSFLTAQHMITEFLRAADTNPKNLKALPYVYPHRINRLAKDILNWNDQHKFTRSLEKILRDGKTHPYVKAQACYLAGRLGDQQAKESARGLLFEFKESLRQQPLKNDQKLKKPNLLLRRTVYISLAYLGDESAQEEYIEILLSDLDMDKFNRGFHLEYYEDQKYSPQEPLTSTDLLEPCPRTFNQLIANLTDGITNPISEIELSTLCSLAQHRHAVGKLVASDRERIIELIDRLLRGHRIRPGTLRTYVTMILNHLRHENFHISRIFDDFYKIKRTKRSGWEKRGILDGESVADHSYGAYLLALFLLPDEWREKTYSKADIMSMLLVHDLAEAITGDVLPSQSNEDSKRREREVYEQLSLLGSYEGLARMREISALWEEFEGQLSFNARVAKDIDKLENLVQLWVYKAQGKIIDDFEEWREELMNALKTPLGEQALQKLLASYESPGVDEFVNHEPQNRS